MHIDVVFSGGGVKAYAFLGALMRMEKEGLEIVRTTGTSAGAIMAGLVAAGYDTDEIKDMIINLDLKKFLDPPALTRFIPFTKWGYLYGNMGFYRGNKLEKWLRQTLAEKDVYTFGDIKPGYLKMIISDLSLRRLIVMPDDLYKVYGIKPETFPISTAIRMSAGFPFFFMPKKLQGRSKRRSVMVDGGLLSNFPLWVFTTGQVKKTRPVLGIRLIDESDTDNYHPISNAPQMLRAFFSTMKEAHDTRYIDQLHVNNIIEIPVEHIEAVDLSINDQTKQRLIERGYDQAERFLEFWPK